MPMFFIYLGVGGLRATELRISPPVVQRGNDTTLACLYELTDAPLYSVKWYRGRHEFYRYSPTENPTTKIFPFAGINVDVSIFNIFKRFIMTRLFYKYIYRLPKKNIRYCTNTKLSDTRKERDAEPSGWNRTDRTNNFVKMNMCVGF